MSVFTYTILSVLLVSLVSLTGVITLSLSGKTLDRIMTYLVSFATGILFGGALIHLLPEAYATTTNPIYVSLWTIGGQEISDYSILINGGLSVKKALAVNFFSALLALVGALFALQLGKSITGFTEALVPLTAGGFIYIAGSDLIPELHHNTDIKKSLIQLLMLIAGVAVMTILAIKF